MKKIIALIILTFGILNASNHKNIDVSYDVSYGIFGKLGIAKASINFNENTYFIKVNAKATGMAKFLSNGKEEIYTSTGTIEGNTFIPKTYTKFSKNNSKKVKKIYTFDYENNNVTVEKIRNKLTTVTKNHTFGGKIESTTQTKWVEERSNDKLKYFAPNDLLSLFFNIKQAIPNFNKGNNYRLKAVGANKNNGYINIIIPNGKKYKTLEEDLGIKSSEKFIAQINQKIFSSKKGELYISLNKHGICDKAVLKDVVMFGDIVGKMTNFKIKDI